AAPVPSTRRRKPGDVAERRTAAAPQLLGPPELRPSPLVVCCFVRGRARYGGRNANANLSASPAQGPQSPNKVSAFAQVTAAIWSTGTPRDSAMAAPTRATKAGRLGRPR